MDSSTGKTISTLRGALPGCLTCEVYGRIADMDDSAADVERAFGCSFCPHGYWWEYTNPNDIEVYKRHVEALWMPKQTDLFGGAKA